MPRTGSDNVFPLVRLSYEDDTPATPPTGQGQLVAGVDKVLRYIDDDGVLVELGGGSAAAHIADTTAAHAASAVAFTPAGTIAATDVQAAIEEVAAEAGGGSSTAVGARAERTATQALTTATETGVQFSATDKFDTDAFHFTSSANLTGTVSKTASSTTITGSGTSFTTELAVNQIIDIPGGGAASRCVVTAIASNTSLTVAIAPAHTASGQTAARVNSAIAIPAGLTGVYGIMAAVTFQNSTTGTFRLLRAYMGIQSTVVTVGPIDINGPFHTNVGSIAQLADVYLLTAGDWVDIRAYQDSGGSLNILSARFALIRYGD